MSGIDVSIRTRLGEFDLDVAFQGPPVGITALFGHSGSGKTSVMRAVAGLLRCPHTRVRFNGDTWQDEQRFLPTHKRPLGYVFQEPSLFAHLDVRRNLLFGWRRIAPAQRRFGFDDAVDLLGLSPLLDRSPSSLSGGERQRVAIARALLTSPRLLLLDEPLSALDHAARHSIMPHLERLRDELALPMLYISHDPAEVGALADHLVLMERGRVRDSGPAAALLTRLDLPIARDQQAESVLEGTVSAHDETFHLTWVALAGGRVGLPRVALPVGHRTRVVIRAQDVSIARTAHHDTSIINILPARVVGTLQRDPTQVVLKLALEDGQILLSRLTRRSMLALGLEEGLWVYAQVKAVALGW